MKSKLSIIFIFVPSGMRRGLSKYGLNACGNRMHFLIGDWIQEINGEFEMGEGFSFGHALNKRIISGKKLSGHAGHGEEGFSDCKNTLIIYLSDNEEESRADYYDAEGHIIHYSMGFTENKIFFSSKNGIFNPRFRMRYTMLSDNSMNIKFDIAPAREENYITYLEGSSYRKPDKN